MKKLILKFGVCLIAIVLALTVVFLGRIYQYPLPMPSSDTIITESPAQSRVVREKSGKVLVRFREFEYRKDWVANFEISNETEKPIFYIGSKSKHSFDYCTLAVKHEESFPANPDGKIDNLSLRTRYICYAEKFMSLQKVESGESLTLSADEYEVRDQLGIKDPKQKTVAQVGFEFFTGEEKRREILWSEEITFPDDIYR